MQRTVGGVVESLSLVEGGLASLEREILTEVNRTEHKVLYLEAALRKDIQEMKNSIREGMLQKYSRELNCHLTIISFVI